jgi:hypothetical protein
MKTLLSIVSAALLTFVMSSSYAAPQQQGKDTQSINGKSTSSYIQLASSAPSKPGSKQKG